MMLDEKQIKNVILCEDIRREDNGKYIIIGVFPSRVLVSKFPAHLSVSAYFEIHAEEVGKCVVFIRVYTGVIKSDNTPAKIRFDIDIESPEPLAIAVPRIALQINEVATLHIDASFDDENWFSIVERNIELKP